MLDAENPNETTEATAAAPTEGATTAGSPPGDAPTEGAAPAKKAAAKRTTKKAAAKKAPAKKAAAKRTTKKAAAADTALPLDGTEDVAAAEAVPAAETTAAPAGEAAVTDGPAGAAPAAKRTARKTAAKKTTAKRTTKKASAPAGEPAVAPAGGESAAAETPAEESTAATPAAAPSATAPLFQAPEPTAPKVTTRRRRTTTVKAAAAPAGPGAAEGVEPPATEPTEATEPSEAVATEAAPAARKKPAKKTAAKRTSKKATPAAAEQAESAEEEPAEESAEALVEADETDEGTESAEGEEQGGERRRRRRGGRRRRRSGGGEDTGGGEEPEAQQSKPAEVADTAAEGEEATDEGGSRRRRRRRPRGEGGEGGEESGGSARARKPRNAEDEITAVSGSTRLEAKKQRRREGREAGRRRAPIVSEAEFLARRESVDRVMVIRQRDDLTQIAVLEDKVLVEHYVARESQTSLIGNVYLGRVQNVLPSMEAAFIDIGKGRNAVLYAGEVNWDALGAKNGTPRKIEAVLKSGQSILVQVSKDPIGHKGARLTSQVSLPGRFLVYVPDGTTSGISRKLPDTERNRLKSLLKEIVPESAGVIVRTAAEGASEEELTHDVERLTARWADIESKVKGGNAPQLLYGEPDLTLKVVRDLFTEDFKQLVIAGDDAWDMVENYVEHVAPDLADRLERYDGERDVFAAYRIDEQIEKALDRKVWLPSGGSLVIDRTEAMTVVDVNTGKFTGSGGNLEETVTKNNLEAAEEFVRQLRLRDIGGIIVVDFIDMVLESNRDLVLRRLVECLGRDRTRHQVAEVTSLGLVQMTRKRIGTGLLEAFSESCEHCQGRGLMLHHEPVEPKKGGLGEDDSRRGRRSGRVRGRDESVSAQTSGGGVPSPKDIAAMARHEEGAPEADKVADTSSGDTAAAETVEAGTEASTESAAESAVAPAEAPTGEAAVESPGEAPGEAAERSGEGRPTRSRGGRGRGRGRATRPSGAPTEASDTQPEATPASTAEISSEVAPEPSAGATSEAPAAPAATDVPASRNEAEGAEPAAEADASTAVAAAPKIVTSVRRRSARRPAGPPVGAYAEPIAALVDAAEADDEVVESTPHVPVKKKGSRRR